MWSLRSGRLFDGWLVFLLLFFVFLGFVGRETFLGVRGWGSRCGRVLGRIGWRFGEWMVCGREWEFLKGRKAFRLYRKG